MSISAMIPVCIEVDGGYWICTSRILCSHGFGTVTGTGPTRRLAYANWVAQL